jgi:hypothetical protein
MRCQASISGQRLPLNEAEGLHESFLSFTAQHPSSREYDGYGTDSGRRLLPYQGTFFGKPFRVSEVTVGLAKPH